MKILQINTTVNSGSTGKIAEDIGQVFINHGHESYIAYGRGNRPSKSKLLKIGSRIDIYLHGLKTLLLDRHGFGSKRATKKLITEIIKIKPDVIGLHNIHGYYINIKILFEYLQKAEIPIIWTFHDCWAFTGHCSFFDSVGCEKWKTQCKKCPKTKLYPSSYGFDNSKINFLEKKYLFNLPKNLQIVTPSKWLMGNVEKSFLKHQIKCINNGIDLNQFYPINKENLLLKHDLLNKKVILGVASIWDKRKGLDDFIKISKFLSDEFQIILIGLSKEQIKKIPKNIIGIQRTENISELATYYSLACVFVNPTYQDNFPTTNIEALACGTPVITYNTGGSPESIDEKTGVIVEKGNIRKLIDEIVQVSNWDKETSKEKCRKRAEELFNKDNRYLDYLELYTSIINNNKKQINE